MTRPRQPWIEGRALARALQNLDVRAGERALPDGGTLRGLYAAKGFAPSDAVCAYQGDVVSLAELEELAKMDPPKFDRVSEYGVQRSDEFGAGFLFCDSDVPGAHLVNHSCGPNARWAEAARGAILVRALQPIAAGEEVTIHYGWLGLRAAVEGKRHACRCAAPYCAGTIELAVEAERRAEFLSTRLPVEEVCNRLVADVANDVDAHEGMLLAYPRGCEQRFIGADSGRFDLEAYFDKLRAGAILAVARLAQLYTSGSVRGSARRLEQIGERYLP